MNVDQLRLYVISPVLTYIGLYTPAAEELLVMTAAQESLMGEFIHQKGHGPALGIYQMEPFTYNDMWDRVLHKHPEIMRKVQTLNAPWRDEGRPDAEEMVGNLFFATAMCRIKYFSIPAPLPPHDDIEALAHYYKKYYNSAGGAATIPQVLGNYHRFASKS